GGTPTATPCPFMNVVQGEYYSVDGAHTVFVRVYDNAGNAASGSYTFTVDAADGGGAPPEPTGDHDSTLLYLGAAVGVVAAVLVVMFLRARRKG
ncbi:MAG: Bacterial Ig-like domain, partial [Candidatus Thermoplasmatota archaeon]|nr:Bacterial Ig-like domain [Candidatus Thermoplasmatota archaeon]